MHRLILIVSTHLVKFGLVQRGPKIDKNVTERIFTTNRESLIFYLVTFLTILAGN